jgi:Ca2+-binding EF-hand superfamily protein
MNPIALAALLLAAAPLAPDASRPPAGPAAGLFVSPMGEPFREGAREAGLERWFAGADSDGDGALGADELRRDAARFFALLEMDKDGEIEPAEMTRYESEIAPEIQLGRGPMTRREIMRMRRDDEQALGAPQGGILAGPHRIRGGNAYGDVEDREGAGRFGLINMPQPVMDADSDLNRGVSAAEFATAAGRRFLLLDTDKDGKLARAELVAQLPRIDPRLERRRRR